MVENGAAERAPPNPAHYKQLPRKIRALAPPTLDLKQRRLAVAAGLLNDFFVLTLQSTAGFRVAAG